MSEQTDRIESFRGLKDWYPGNEDVTDIAVDRAIIFSKVISASSPAVFPMPDGGITFEWSNSFGHASIDFYPEEERSPDLLHGEVFVMSDEER